MAGLDRQSFLSGLEFQPDQFQIDAFDALDRGNNVLVSAPTGSGKTLVAEYAIARTLSASGRAFYTTPIKALSNQKYMELVAAHGQSVVGLLTGDTSINSDASILVMTTEVLRNMIYSRSTALEGLHTVVLDEVHFIQDAFRGPVWEEVIIHLAPEVRLVCLSATVTNAEEVGQWLTNVRGPTVPIVERHRPVPMEHLYFVGDKRSHDMKVFALEKGHHSNKELQQFLGATAGRKPADRRQGRASRFFPPSRIDVVEELKARDLLPCIHFLFSRNQCDESAESLRRAGVRLTTDGEARAIVDIAESRVADFPDDDLAVLGYARFLDQLESGVGTHHAGLVPAFREIVERGFSEGLIKIVFATETLAVGINMPARSVVLDKLTKFTGSGHRMLQPSDFAQLTGRAGRRGLDDHGVAVILWSPFVKIGDVLDLVNSKRFELRSAFRPTYNMAANLVRMNSRDEALHLLNLSLARFQRGEGLVKQFNGLLQLLEELGYVDGWKLTPNGEMLRQIYHESDLLIAECIREGALSGLEPAEMASLASCFVFEARGGAEDREIHFPSPRLKSAFRAVEKVSARLSRLETNHGLATHRIVDPGLMGHIAEWAIGDDLGEVLGFDDVSGGDFVRSSKQILDLLRQLSEVMPNTADREVARAAIPLIDRGLVALSQVPFEAPHAD